MRSVPCQEGPLAEEMATHCSILAWEIPWTEEPGGGKSGAAERLSTHAQLRLILGLTGCFGTASVLRPVLAACPPPESGLTGDWNLTCVQFINVSSAGRLLQAALWGEAYGGDAPARALPNIHWMNPMLDK